jgi:hypothetical protein
MRARGVEPPRAEAHRDLNPARLPVPPRPRRYKDRAHGYAVLVSDDQPSFVDPGYTEPEVARDPAERERESALTDDTRYARELEAEEAARHAAAERLKEEPPLEPPRD